MPKGQGHIITANVRLKMIESRNPYYKFGLYFSKHWNRWFVFSRDGKYTRFSRIVARNMIGRELNKNEDVHHIDHDKTNDNDYNLKVMSHAEHTSLHAFGFKKGHIATPEHRRKLSIVGMKRKQSEETRKKISLSNLGKNYGRIGWKHSEETKSKIGSSNIGYKKFLGRKHSEETLIKMSLAQKKRREKEKTK